MNFIELQNAVIAGEKMLDSVNDVDIDFSISDLNKKQKVNQVDFTGLIRFLTDANFSENRQRKTVQSLPSDQLFWSGMGVRRCLDNSREE